MDKNATNQRRNVGLLAQSARLWADLPLRGKGLVVVTIPIVALSLSAFSFHLGREVQ